MKQKTVGMGFVLLFCLGIWAGMSLLPEAEETKGRRVLFGQGSDRLYAGLPEGETETVIIEKLPAADDLFALPDAAHPVPDAQLCSLRSMVGSFLPVEGDVMLREEVIYALCDMALDYPLAEGITIIRGGLTGEEQNAWQKEAVERYEKVGREAVEAMALVPEGGESEHQTGWAVDIRLTGTLQMGRRDALQRNAAGRWLTEQMGSYGFVYEGAGAACEDIHLRYVGKPMAKVIHVSGQGLEEMLSMLEKEKAVTLERNGQVILCMQLVEEETMQIPRGMITRLSADNRGRTILCATAE